MAEAIKCRNQKCETTFVPRCAQHGFCSEKCRRSARGNLWKVVREVAIERDEHTCQDCHTTDTRLEVHHLLALCFGGTNALYNLITLCPTCHRARHRTWKSQAQTEAA